MAFDVAVLGCGPAGLMAAHAAHHMEANVTIFSKTTKQSGMYGAQYLHKPIPGVPPGERVDVNYTLQGEHDGYRNKVYGDEDVEVSPLTLLEEHPAWDIRATYNWLWTEYESEIVERELDFASVWDLAYDFDFIVSTIPRPVLCRANRHKFISADIWAAGEAPFEQRLNIVKVPNNTVICNGEPDVDWYRASMIFGAKTIEWPIERKPTGVWVARVRKPLRNNCDCHNSVLHVGRYGAWKKGVLSHEAYDETYKAIRDGAW